MSRCCVKCMHTLTGLPEPLTLTPLHTGEPTHTRTRVELCKCFPALAIQTKSLIKNAQTSDNSSLSLDISLFNLCCKNAELDTSVQRQVIVVLSLIENKQFYVYLS